jgi:hypothetical protein
LSAGTSHLRSPPVTLKSTSAPFLASDCIASKTSGEYPEPSNIRSNAPERRASSASDTSVVIR